MGAARPMATGLAARTSPTVRTSRPSVSERKNGPEIVTARTAAKLRNPVVRPMAKSVLRNIPSSTIGSLTRRSTITKPTIAATPTPNITSRCGRVKPCSCPIDSANRISNNEAKNNPAPA